MIEKKKCSLCKEIKAITEFYKIRNGKYFNSYCKPCANKDQMKRAKIQYNNDEEFRKTKLNHNANWREKNRKRFNYAISNWKKQNKHLVRFYSANRYSAEIYRTPKWANLERIKEIYKNCPEGHSVDHIVPLQGKTVCGLHVENNLQYLTPSENSKKGNRFDD